MAAPVVVSLVTEHDNCHSLSFERSGWCGFIIQWSLWVASNFQSNSSGHYSNNSIYLHPGEMIILNHIVTLINVRLHQYWAILIRFSTLCHLFDSKRHNFLRVSNLHRSVIQPSSKAHFVCNISPSTRLSINLPMIFVTPGSFSRARAAGTRATKKLLASIECCRIVILNAAWVISNDFLGIQIWKFWNCSAQVKLKSEEMHTTTMWYWLLLLLPDLKLVSGCN